MTSGQDEVVTVATFPYPPPAEMAKIKLEAEGIESIIVGGMAIGSPAMGYQPEARLMVRREDAERAATILEEIRNQDKDDPFLRLMNSQVGVSAETESTITYLEPPEQAYADVRSLLAKMGSIQNESKETKQIDVILGFWLNKLPLRVKIQAGSDEKSSQVVMIGNPLLAKKLTKKLERL